MKTCMLYDRVLFKYLWSCFDFKYLKTKSMDSGGVAHHVGCEQNKKELKST